MTGATHDEADLRRLLLGTLAEAEREALEARLLAEEELFALAAEIEDELAGEYAAHTLGDDERRAFDAQLTRVPRLGERVRAARALDRAAARATPVPPPAWRRLLAWLRPAPGAWQWSLASGLCGALLVGALMRSDVVLLRDESATLRRERDAAQADAARLFREQATRARREAQTFALAPGVSRGAEGPAQLLLAARVGLVSFHLDLDGPVRGPFRALLETDSGRQVFVRDGLSAADPSGYAYVEVDVPADLLASGPYALQLSTLAGGRATSAGRYVFVLVRQP